MQKLPHTKSSYLIPERKIGFYLLHDKYFTIPYIIDTIPNLPAVRNLPTQAKNNLWVVAINGYETITEKG